MDSSTPRKFVLASRASKLAQVQTHSVRDALLASADSARSEFEVAFMHTGGDKNKTDALYLLGGKALWTEELDVALRNSSVDFVVHCLKDVPTILPEGSELGAIMPREDPSDSLVVKAGLSYKSLEDLPDGSVIGTGSVRRVAQLRRAFPKLKFADVRGNIDTRLAKLDDPAGIYSALILARAGLSRTNMLHRVSSSIVPPHLFHAVGQGALGVQIRSNDAEARKFLLSLSHRPSEMRCRAERSMLRVLEGGCSVPVGVDSVFTPASVGGDDGDSSLVDLLQLTGTVTSLNGDNQVIYSQTASITTAEDAEALGVTVGRHLIENGANVILDEVNRERSAKQAQDAEKKAALLGVASSVPHVTASGSDESQINTAIDSATHAIPPPSNLAYSVPLSATAHTEVPADHPPVFLAKGEVCLRPQTPPLSNIVPAVPAEEPEESTIAATESMASSRASSTSGKATKRKAPEVSKADANPKPSKRRSSRTAAAAATAKIVRQVDDDDDDDF